jgi:DNA-binding PadR family transcriptional regulator
MKVTPSGDKKMASTTITIGKIERRIITHFMDLIVLSILNHDGNEISGYDLIKYFHRRFNILTSPGTVYSQLHHMEREGWLKSRENNGKRVYTLTPHGKEETKLLLNAENRITNFISIMLHNSGA